MSKFHLDLLLALSISIIANIITPYLQNLLHIHAINAAHRKNRRIAALHRLAQMSSHEYSDGSASGSARGSIDSAIDGLIDGTIDGSMHGPIYGSMHGSMHGLSHRLMLGSLYRFDNNIGHPVIVKKYKIHGFVLATGALIWSLLRSGPVAMVISLVAMVITGIRIKRSSKFIHPISPAATARSLEYQEIS
jgi:hypothetical protein